MKFPHPHFQLKSSWYHRLGKDAVVDWVVIIIISTLTTIATVAFALFNFFTMDARLSDARTMVRSTASNSMVDVQKLEETLYIFDARTKERAELIHAYTGSYDPSVGSYATGPMPKFISPPAVKAKAPTNGTSVLPNTASTKVEIN